MWMESLDEAAAWCCCVAVGLMLMVVMSLVVASFDVRWYAADVDVATDVVADVAAEDSNWNYTEDIDAVVDAEAVAEPEDFHRNTERAVAAVDVAVVAVAA